MIPTTIKLIISTYVSFISQVSAGWCSFTLMLAVVVVVDSICGIGNGTLCMTEHH